MFDPTVNRSSGDDRNRPQFESLEQRLLLTTLQAGEWLVYNGSQDRFILATMTGNTGTAEILALDLDSGDLANIGALMGALDGSFGPVDVFGGLTGVSALDTILGTPPSYLDQQIVLGLGGNQATGVLYSYDNFTYKLWQVDQVNGVRLAGTDLDVRDGAEPSYSYTIDAMTVNGAGTIVAAGFVVDMDTANPPPVPSPAGQFLINIDPATGTGTIINPLAPLVVPGGSGRVTDMAYSGGQLYGIDGENIFSMVDTSGQIGQAYALWDVTNNNAPITGATGLEDVAGTLYVSDASTVYTVNPANGNCTPLNGTLSRQDMTDLASDGANLFGVFSSNGESILAMIKTDPAKNVDPFTVYLSKADMSTKLTFTEVGRVTINSVVTPAMALVTVASSASKMSPRLLIAAVSTRDARVATASAGRRSPPRAATTRASELSRYAPCGCAAGR